MNDSYELNESVRKAVVNYSDSLVKILSLDKKYRVPIHLHYYEGYSLEEIADILHAKPATVGTWLARGRNKLKEVIGGDL
ncbi:sigma factor-like helix-turn-helix DNA-binding protein [Paenibacillus sp. LHD-38]|uniref:RNA polymerase sigma factor n=1 Tax=Paenibacillus sp. LHD-38 TaxID=3072143 RepID=UPI00280D4515|nr:sigma factor-like helix-turn-helix DNA-binding protein [Paenibacillus sp. LHD-38]MDQ8734534.1 sigma factor-like helix-turn-helix DNA-binding protein [Paenibacillus sp. LHD-38]